MEQHYRNLSEFFMKKEEFLIFDNVVHPVYFPYFFASIKFRQKNGSVKKNDTF